MNLKAWSSKHVKTVVVATALMSVGFTPTAIAGKVHTQALGLTCAIHSTSSWCTPTTPAPAAASAAVTR